MKKIIYLACCIAFFVQLAACKKETNTKIAKAGSPSSENAIIPKTSIPLTHEEAGILNKLIAERKINDPADFLAKIDSLKSLTTQKKSGITMGTMARVTDEPDYNYSEEDLEENAIITGAQNDELQYYDLSDGSARYKSRFEQEMKFAIRQNSILVIVPFQFNWKQSTSSQHQYYVSQTWPDAQTPQLLPTGMYWGEVTQGNSSYVNGGTGSDYYGGCPITAYGGASEKRTQLISTTGAIKISTNLNLEVFEAGTEIEAGFTVQSASYTYNQYTMDAIGQIYGYNDQLQIPGSRFFGDIKCKQYGILKNQ